MKFVVISDIHGSSYYMQEMKKDIDEENPDKIIVLGDLYYHGPRNPLGKEYNPMEVANILNSMKDKILAVRGNCDAEVDQMISEFEIKENIILKINEKKFFFTHGHKINIDHLPEEKIDVLLYGHFHKGFITEKDGIIIASPGSISLPKMDTKNSYMVIENGYLILKELSGNIIDEKKFI